MRQRPIIALLGGGQLGRMFIENALRYDARVHVLDPDPQCPCAGIAERFVQGSFADHDTVLRFVRDADVVGIEIEHVSVTALEAAQALGKRVIPDPAVLRTIQDKGTQKVFYRDHGLPTAPFTLVDGRDALRAAPPAFPAFLKARTGGYDGKGVMALRGPTDLPLAFEGPSVVEAQVAVALELAVLVVRDAAGNTLAYDPVEMVFDPRYNLVDHLRAPARLDARTLEDARRLAVQVADAFHVPGLYAVELFLTTHGELLVNETAPRAHNSGHHTIEACASSQFDQLLRLYLGLPIGDARLRAHAAMVNLVGEQGSGEPVLTGLSDIVHVPGAFVHLYGKRETRDGRKMGHVTLLAEDHAALDQGIAVTRLHGRVVPATTNTNNTSTRT
ncbi:MAG TPA: 5-(carboxyamino)imidazole ribonucleotide synthase [Flavobacteriales bacterium]|nr:5-(carboxyamino)imidazole ribonucleotide synthase [Flavobacteriales bacterium]HMR28580.1 5-(carboxyamino)imidazole ribonucleotide synthase [Flavobacteriales bacterium]